MAQGPACANCGPPAALANLSRTGCDNEDDVLAERGQHSKSRNFFIAAHSVAGGGALAARHAATNGERAGGAPSKPHPPMQRDRVERGPPVERRRAASRRGPPERQTSPPGSGRLRRAITSTAARAYPQADGGIEPGKSGRDHKPRRPRSSKTIFDRRRSPYGRSRTRHRRCRELGQGTHRSAAGGTQRVTSDR